MVSVELLYWFNLLSVIILGPGVILVFLWFLKELKTVVKLLKSTSEK